MTRDVPPTDAREWAKQSTLPIMWIRSPDAERIGQIRALVTSLIRREPYLVSVMRYARRLADVPDGSIILAAQGAASGFIRPAERADAVLMLCDFDPEYAHNQMATERGMVRSIVRRLNWVLTVRYFRRLYPAVARVITLTSVDETQVKQLAPESTVLNIAVGMQPPSPAVRSPAVPTRLVFVGGGPRNVESIKLSIEGVIPHLRRLGVDTPLEVGGRLSHTDLCEIRNSMDLAGLPDDSIELVGQVDDIGALLSPGSVLLAPFALGAGVKIKCIDAMMRGSLVATTPEGARGTPLLRDETGIVEKNLATLAKKVAMILGTRAGGLIADRGRTAAVELHSLTSHRRELIRALDVCPEN